MIPSALVGLPLPNGVRLSEVMASTPGSDKDGAANKSQWIELYNGSTTAQDISGWMLTSRGSKGQVQRLPAGTILQPGKYLLVYPTPSGIVLADKDELILLFDDTARLVDLAPIPSAKGDASYSRDVAGQWHSDWKASPGAPNSPPSKIGP